MKWRGCHFAEGGKDIHKRGREGQRDTTRAGYSGREGGRRDKKGKDGIRGRTG
jgi:hypothetical protein